MTEVPNSQAYIFAEEGETSRRLIRVADLGAQDVRDGFHRTDVGPEDKVIDVGGGPLGALRELSNLVGPRGTVVGLDMDQASLQHARAILDRSGRENVRLVHATVNGESSDELRRLGPFDAAHCRLFLVHQQDAGETLRRIAALLRPGGHIVAIEPLLGVALPRSDPEVPEIDQIRQWLRDVLLRRGGSPDVGYHFHSICRQAGLREVSQRSAGVVRSHNAREAIQFYRESLMGVRPVLVQHKVASVGEIDTAVGHLAEAEGWKFEVLFIGLSVELVAQVPPSA
jgi:SAM-dependent methyltransferase